MKRFFLFLLFLIPVVAFAQVVAQAPQSADQAVGLLPVLASFFHNGQYLALGGGITLVVCFVLNSYVFPKLSLGPALIPIVSGVVGILSGAGLAIVNGASLQQASLAILSGSVATHLWESIFQYLVSKVPKA